MFTIYRNISLPKIWGLQLKIKVIGAGAETDKGIAVFDKTSRRMEIFNTKEKTWILKQTFNDVMMEKEFCTVVLEEHLYVFLKNKNVYRIVHSDPDSTWEKMASKKFGYGPSIVLDGMAYSLSNIKNDTNNMEIFDPSLNKWQVLPKKTLAVYGAPLIVAEGKIFVIGGFDSASRVHTEVKKFDPATSSWSLDVPLSKARCHSSAITVENRIYVLGGHDATRTMTSAVEYRCPKSKAWITITPLKNPRSSFSSCCIDGKIYAVGEGQNNPQKIEEFDLEKKEWKVV